MSTYGSILQLKQNGTTKADHFVKSFHKNQNKGGGRFVWISGNNAAITEYPGITVKPSVTTDGYWIRQEYVNGQILTPEMCGALNVNQTMSASGILQAEADTLYGSGFCVVTSDTCDWAGWQSLLNSARSLNIGEVHGGSGKQYYINKGLNCGKQATHFTLNGNNCTLNTTNNGTYSIITRPVPVNQAAAEIQVSWQFNVRNFIIIGQSNQTGIEVNCSYGSTIEKNWIWYCLEGIVLRWNHACEVRNNFWQWTRFGARSDYGTWTGALSTNSQSNAVYYYGNHHACDDSQGISYRIYASSDNVIKDFICEQVTAKKVVEFDGRGFGGNFNLTVENGHIEYNSGLTDYAFDIRCNGGIFNIKNVNYPMGIGGNKMVKAVSTGGLGSMLIENIFDWDIPVDGKLFYNSEFSWEFRHNQFVLGNMNIPALFNGTPVSACNNPPACGYNKYKIYDIPR